MAKATIQVEFNLDHDSFQDLIDMAGYGIGYWADKAEVHEDRYVVHATEDAQSKLHTITADDYSRVILDVLQGGNDAHHIMLRTACFRLVFDNDMSDLDASDADTLTQLACFGEIVYG